ncbi:MAG TPA: hexose kinase [Methylomirabilota bacterium]|nr:hexose kinase [Methylomirabilota bacterium]
MATVTEAVAVGRLVGVALNPSIDKLAAVDRLEPGAIHRPELLTSVPGGKALNAVRTARALDAPADVVAVVAGHAGAWLVEQLESRGIRGWFVPVAGETRTCVSVLDRAAGELTEFYEGGNDLPEDRWGSVEDALRDSLADRPDHVAVLLAGSLPPGAPADAYRRLASQAAATGARVVVDFGGAPLASALDARPWLVKINAAEASATTGLPTTTRREVTAAARRLIEGGAEHAVITMGVDGAVLVTPAAAWSVGRAPVIGPYSVGSGDALIGGFVAALSRGEDLPTALGHGAAAATANALIPGQGEVDPRDVARLFPVCEVTRL